VCVKVRWIWSVDPTLGSVALFFHGFTNVIGSPITRLRLSCSFSLYCRPCTGFCSKPPWSRCLSLTSGEGREAVSFSSRTFSFCQSFFFGFLFSLLAAQERVRIRRTGWRFFRDEDWTLPFLPRIESSSCLAFSPRNSSLVWCRRVNHTSSPSFGRDPDLDRLSVFLYRFESFMTVRR